MGARCGCRTVCVPVVSVSLSTLHGTAARRFACSLISRWIQRAPLLYRVRSIQGVGHPRGVQGEFNAASNRPIVCHRAERAGAPLTGNGENDPAITGGKRTWSSRFTANYLFYRPRIFHKIGKLIANGKESLIKNQL